MTNDGNPDILHINIIEGLAVQIQEHLVSVNPRTAEQAEAKDKALNKFNAWQRNQLFDLRREFEE